MTNASEISALRNQMISLTHLLEGCENISPYTMQLVVDFYIDSLVSGNAEMVGNAAILMKTALGKAAERIVVLESLLESERKLRQADKAFALKNEIYL